MRSSLRGALGLLFPMVVAASGSALVAWLAGRHVPAGVLVLALVALLLGAVTAAALTTVAVMRRQWWWAASLVAMWPVTVPLYLRRRPGRPDERPGEPGSEGGSQHPQV
jgi:type II secretory pathway component PulF